MRIGIGSYAFAWAIGVPPQMPPRPMTAAQLLHKAIDLQVLIVQICDNLPLHRFTEHELQRLADQATQNGLQIEVGTRGIDPQHLRRYLRIARQFQSPFVRVVIDTVDHQPEVDEVVVTLTTVLPEFADAGVSLAIENHDRFTVRQFCVILDRLKSFPVGICLDTVNSFGSLEGPEVVVEALAPWVLSLHVKDFVIHRVSHQMGFVIEGCPAGEGRLNLPWLVQRLSAAGRDVNAILELWPAPEPTIEQTIAKEAAWAARSITNLRRLLT